MEARTPRKDRCAKDHGAPNHISKTVLSTVTLAHLRRLELVIGQGGTTDGDTLAESSRPQVVVTCRRSM